MTKISADEKPVTWRAMRSTLHDQRRSMETWVLGALALVSAHVIQFVSIGLTWKGNQREGEGVSGWDLATANFGTGLLQLGSILILAISVVVAFLALSTQRRGLFSLVAVLSIARVVLTFVVATSAEVRDWGTRPGVTVAVAAALITAVTASAVAAAVE